MELKGVRRLPAIVTRCVLAQPAHQAIEYQLGFVLNSRSLYIRRC